MFGDLLEPWLFGAEVTADLEGETGLVGDWAEYSLVDCVLSSCKR